MDRDADGGYRMTFATPGAPPRTAKVVRAVGSRRYQQYLAAEGDTLWRLPVAYHIEEKRWFPMTGAFLFSDRATIDDATRPRYGRRRVRPPRHALERQLRLLPQRRAQSGARSVDGRVPDHGRRAGDRLRGLPRPGCASTPAPTPTRRAATRFTWRRGADPTIVNPSRLSPARAADICGRCHGQRITADVGPFLAHGDPFVAATISRATAGRWGATRRCAATRPRSPRASGRTARRG